MLYIISTPIGNLKDISLRAVDVLESIEILLCEDTRITGNLLKLIEIKNKPKLVAFYDEVEEQKIPQIINWLREEKRIGLVTDAGTPLLSDPGWLLVKKCQELGLKYTAVPGSSAVMNALVLSGLQMGRFAYLGFLPKKSGERKRLLVKYKDVEGAKVVFESPKRIKRLLEELKEAGYENIRLVREMTKKFESVEREVKDERGEVTVVFI